jgi:hypothetical protein
MASALVRELAKRMGELILSTPTSSGAGSSSAGTTLVDSGLLQYLPQTIGTGQEQFMPWVYGSTTVDPTNIGITRRATMWNSASAVTALTFPVAWPTAITASGSSGSPVYEVYLRNERSRFLEAINSGVGQLGLWWLREFVDTSITTAAQTWSYTLPAGQYIGRLWQVEYQVDTNASDIGFPYADAVDLDWEVRESTAADGTFTQTLQFGILPPPNRTLRLRGEAYYPDLVSDSDVLALSGKWQRPCTEWIYKYGACLLNSWLANQLPMGDVDRYMKLEQTLLQEAESLKMQMQKPHKPGRIVVPGKGRGLFGYSTLADSPSYLGGFHSP